jgi:hypothetical protein
MRNRAGVICSGFSGIHPPPRETSIDSTVSLQLLRDFTSLTSA